jgi:hypothetical protein
MINSFLRLVVTIAPDFHVLWKATKFLGAGNNPYLAQDIFTGVGYPLNTLLFYFPLTIFNYQLAQNIFTFLSFLSLLGIIYISVIIARKKFSWRYLLFIVFLSLISFPTKFTLGMGQNNLLAFFLVLLSYCFFKKRKRVVSGLLLGAAIAFKTIFGFFILYYFIKKEWKVFFYSLVVVSFSIIFIGLIFDINFYTYYFHKVIPPLLNVSGREIYYNQGLMGFFSRLTSDLILRKQLTSISSLVILFTVGYFSIRKRKNDLSFSLFIIGLLLIDTLSWQHHFVWLVFPYILLFEKARKYKIGVPILITISYVLISWNFGKTLAFSGLLGSIVYSHTFIGALILLFVNIYLLKRENIKR